MPGLRAYLTLDAGEAFGAEWEATFGPRRRKQRKRRASSATSTSRPNLGRGGSEATLAGPPYESWEVGGSSSHLSLAESNGGETFGEEEGDDVDWDDGGESDGTQHLSPDQRRAWRIIDRMRRDEDWMGTSYKLLGVSSRSTFRCLRLTPLSHSTTATASPMSSSGVSQVEEHLPG